MGRNGRACGLFVYITVQQWATAPFCGQIPPLWPFSRCEGIEVARDGLVSAKGTPRCHIIVRWGIYDSVMATRDKQAVGCGNNSMLELINTGFEVFRTVDSNQNPTQPYVKVGGQTYCYIAFR